MMTARNTPATKLWEHQQRALDFIQGKPGAMLAMEMGTGKDLRNDTPIPTAAGWVEIGSIVPGETVFDEHGNPCKVTGVYPQGERPVYEVEFDDGAVIFAGADHQWITLTQQERTEIQEGRRSRLNWTRGLTPISTLDIRDSLNDTREISGVEHSIPTAMPLNMPDADLPESPNIIGFSLGANKPQAPETDFFLKKLEKFDTTSDDEKYIPNHYLRASVSQRRDLLNRLRAYQSHLGQLGDHQFICASDKLAEGVLELAISLGLKATMEEQELPPGVARACKQYRVRMSQTVNKPESDGRPRPRRQAALTQLGNPNQSAERYIRAVREAGTAQTTCITVDSPSRMFLAGRAMIPTHNTLTAIEHVRLTGANRILIVAPLSVVDHVWEDQIKQHAPGWLDYVLLGQRHPSTARKINAAETALARVRKDDPIAAVVNYETTIRPEFREWASRRRWDMLVLDESHKAKSPDGVTAKWIADLALGIPNRLALTGTPMPHSPMDLFSQYRILDNRIFGSSFHRFRDRYAVLAPLPETGKPKTEKQKQTKRIIDFKNRDELSERFHRIAFEVRSEDVLELPPVNRLHYRVRLGDKAQKLYQQLQEQLVAILETGQTIHAPNALAQLLRLQQLTSGFAASRNVAPTLVDEAKIKATTDILDSIGQDEPVVVFGRFLHDLEAVRKIAENAGRPAWELSGETKQLDEWKEHGGVLTAQIQAGGIGVDLTKARYCIYYSLGYSLGEYLQSQARVHRPGQDRTVHQIHLIAAGTVDERVMRSLERKEDVIDSILTNGLG